MSDHLKYSGADAAVQRRTLVEMIKADAVLMAFLHGMEELDLPDPLLGSGAMAFAYFTEHQPHGFWPIQNGGELAVLYCFSLLLIAFAGTGAFALAGHPKR